MKKVVSAFAVFFFARFGGPLLAEQTAYVTDSLLLRLYSQSNDASEVTESIKSGDAVEVLESQGEFTQVRIYDGTTVWVKSAFLAEDDPPQNYFITL
ncbi:MAG: SH3 domain-containing protein [Gammaproteobacteria bacterium]|nr:SH3 domain-containing protein [Gammaproteobacteria bacterium]